MNDIWDFPIWFKFLKHFLFRLRRLDYQYTKQTTFVFTRWGYLVTILARLSCREVEEDNQDRWAVSSLHKVQVSDNMTWIHSDWWRVHVFKFFCNIESSKQSNIKKAYVYLIQWVWLAFRQIQILPMLPYDCCLCSVKDKFRSSITNCGNLFRIWALKFRNF